MSSYDLGTASGTIQLNYQDNASGPAGQSLDSISDTAGDTADSIGSSFATAFEGIVTAAAATAVAVTASLLKTGVGFNAAEQQAKLAFTSILGSATEATSMMQSLDDLTNEFHFPVEDFENAAETMLNLGLNVTQVTSGLQAAADAAAAMGGNTTIIDTLANAFGRIQVAGHLTSAVVTQLGRDGINALGLISSATGQTADQIRSQISAGTLSAAQAIQDLTTGMQNQFGAAGANVTSTWNGAIDNVKTQYQSLGSALASALVPTTSGGLGVTVLNDVAQVLTNLIPLAQTLSGALNSALGPAVTKIANGFAAMTGNLNVSGIMGSLSSLLPLIVGIGAVIDQFLPKVLGQLPVIGGALKDLSGPFGLVLSLIGLVVANSPQLLGGAFQAIGAALQSLAPLFTILTGLINQVAGVIGNVLAGVISAVLPPLLQAFSALVPVITSLAGVVSGALMTVMSALAPVIIQLANTFSGLLSTALGLIIPIITAVAPLFGQLVTVLAQMIASVLPALTPLFAMLATVIGTILGAIAPLIPVIIQLLGAVVALAVPLLALIGPILTPLIGLVTQLLAAVLPLITTLLGLLVPALSFLITILTDIITWIAQFITTLIGWAEGNEAATARVTTVWNSIMGFFGTIGSFFAGIWNGIIGGVSSFIGTLVGEFDGIQSKILGALSGAGSWLLHIGEDIINGLINGFKNAVGGVESFLKGLTGDIASWKGPAPLDAVLLRPAGQSIIQSLIDGFTDKFGDVKSSLQSLTSSLPVTMSMLGNNAINSSAGAGPSLPAGANFGSTTNTNSRVINLTQNITTPYDPVTFARTIQQTFADDMGGAA